MNILANIKSAKKRIKVIKAKTLRNKICLLYTSGEGGFGYDPLFWYDEYGETFAELSQDDKNAISHRGVAAAKLCHMISERIAAAENTETEENK